MLERGARLPHFAVTTVDGSRVDYSQIWQRRNLVLVCLPAEETTTGLLQSYLAELADRVRELAGDDTECVATSENVAGVPSPGVVVADRWGEVYFVAGGASVQDLPSHDEVLEWLRYVQHECPECQGEAR